MRQPSLRILALSALLALAVTLCPACIYHPVSIVPSLAPVDPTRPIVRYKAIQGEACTHVILGLFPASSNSLLEATWKMKRLVNVDGYVEVMLEEKTFFWVFGYSKCTVVTGYPFTYGTEPRALQVRGYDGAAAALAPDPEPAAEPASDPEPAAEPASRPSSQPAAEPTAQPARDPEPAAPPFDCTGACGRFGDLAGTTSLIRRVVRERCESRCATGDAAYRQCVAAARRSDDVKRCNSLPAP